MFRFIQIGAPRKKLDEKTNFQPGSVYRCPFYGPCQTYALVKNFGKTEGTGDKVYTGKEDEAWIGSSMDIKQYNNYERSVVSKFLIKSIHDEIKKIYAYILQVCANRWINKNLKNSENIDITYLMTGACYVQDLFNETYESHVLKLLPLVDSSKLKKTHMTT